jgi:hypothetical protein
MKATLFRLTCTAAALLLSGCAHHQTGECRGCTTVYTEGGQLAISHFVPADPSEVERVAAVYCQEHPPGKPVIAQHPELQKYPHWAVYLFKCEDRDAQTVSSKGRPDLPAPPSSAPPAPVPPPPAPPATTQPPAVQPSVGIEAEKLGATCAGMGFQKGTPEYGNCVLKLMELSNAQAEQIRQQQRLPALTTIRLPSGQTLSCTQAGNQVNCN